MREWFWRYWEWASNFNPVIGQFFDYNVLGFDTRYIILALIVYGYYFWDDNHLSDDENQEIEENKNNFSKKKIYYYKIFGVELWYHFMVLSVVIAAFCLVKLFYYISCFT